MVVANALWGLLLHRAADVEEIVGDHAEPDPALHSGFSLVAAAVEPVPPSTLMRPSHPVRHFWPLRNQRFFCSRLRSRLLVERLGIETRLTPIALAAASFFIE